MVFYQLERCDPMNAPEVEKMNELLNSCTKVTSRLIESVIQTNQLASQTTPEMQQLFQQWISLLAGELMNHIEDGGNIEIDEISTRIGISPSTVFSLLLFLHRKGDINLKSVTLEKADGKNREICHCLTE